MEENAMIQEQPDAIPAEPETSAVAEKDTTAAETTAEADGQTESQDATPTETEPEAEAQPITIPVRFKHENRELSMEEATEYAEIGMAAAEPYNRMRRIAAGCGKSVGQLLDDLENAGKEQLYAKLLEDSGGNEQIAKRLLEVELKERDAAYDNTVKQEQQEELTAREQLQQRLANELNELQAEFPDVKGAKDVPKSVYTDAINNGRHLLDAYLRYTRAEGKKIQAAAKAQEAAAAASVGSRQDNPPEKSRDPFVDAMSRGLHSVLE